MIVTLSLAAALAAAPIRGPKVSFEPSAPRLGDTVSVFIDVAEGAPAPTLTARGHVFPAFDLGGGRYRAFVPISPLDKPGRWRIAVESGARKASATVPVAARRFGVQRLWLKGVPTGLDDVEREKVGAVKDLASAEKRWKGPFRVPAAGRMSSPFGVRRYRNGVFLTDYYHRGVDYASGAGAPVVAPADGTVMLVGLEGEGFRVHGNTVGLDHGHGVVSLLLHLARAVVREGDVLKEGDPVGLVGGTGAVTAPHLHWGLYVNGVAVDPGPWLQAAID